MIRKSTISLNYINSGKLSILVNFIYEYSKLVNFYIDRLWINKTFKDKYLNKNELISNTWLSSRIKNVAGMQALQIVKSQRKNKIKTKPFFNKKSINLDINFIDIQPGNNSFDLWIKIKSLTTNPGGFLIPSKKHYHFNSFVNNGWNIKKSARLRFDRGILSLDVFFEKIMLIKTIGKAVGLDSGIKKLAVLSDGQIIGKDLESKIDKILRKQHGSKSQKRAIIERNEYINSEIKKIDFSKIKDLVVEDLNNLHKNNKKISSKLNSWNYSYFLKKLDSLCEVVGVQCHKVDPSYTSQTCPRCGFIHRSNRVGELFKCKKCDYTSDADLVASLNILNRWIIG